MHQNSSPSEPSHQADGFEASQRAASEHPDNFRSQLKRYWPFVTGFWALILMGVGSFIVFIQLIASGYFEELPSTSSLENPEMPLASEVYTQDGRLLGKYYAQNRTRASYQEVEGPLTKALIATEDVRFYQHSGIDWKRVAAVPYYLLIKGEKQGASTITQQLAKNLFERQGFSTWFEIIVTKFKEWIIAAELERRYTKNEIITMYFNTVSFGSNTYGIKSACRTYFNKPPDSLQVEEAAVLVGMLKATTRYNPKLNPEDARNRRNVVLSQMEKYGYLASQAKEDSLQQLPIKLNYQVASHTRGMATYFREHLRMRLNQWCEENNYNLYEDGLRIYTTLNSRIQQHAEEAVKEHISDLQQEFFASWKGQAPWGEQGEIVLEQGMKRSDRYKNLQARGWDEKRIQESFHQPTQMTVFSWNGEIDTVMTPWDSIKYYKHFLHTGFMAVSPSSGKIRAWVGGIDYKHFQYDHVNIRAKRQVGSTFKPFVYTVGVMNGYSPCQQVANVPVRFEKETWGLDEDWMPKNAGGEYGGMVRLKEGLAESMNTVTSYLMKQIGPQPVVDLAHKMGIKSKLQAVPSIALGTADISVYEMVGAFNTYANHGVWVEPYFIERIEDKQGNVLQEFVPKKVEVLNEKNNYVMLKMLQEVTHGYGTAVRLRYRYDLRGEIAAKTGTTQNQSDGWFLGATPQLTGGCWVGAEDRAVHFRSLRQGQGASTALPIWAKFMQRVYADTSLDISQYDRFDRPGGPLPAELDCRKYEVAEESRGGSENLFK